MKNRADKKPYTGRAAAFLPAGGATAAEQTLELAPGAIGFVTADINRTARYFAFVAPNGNEVQAPTGHFTCYTDFGSRPVAAGSWYTVVRCGGFSSSSSNAFGSYEAPIRLKSGASGANNGADQYNATGNVDKIDVIAYSVIPIDRPEITDMSAEGKEQVATMELFAGAIGAFKNPASHRIVCFDDLLEAAEVVQLADLLLRMLNRVTTI